MKAIGEDQAVLLTIDEDHFECELWRDFFPVLAFSPQSLQQCKQEVMLEDIVSWVRLAQARACNIGNVTPARQACTQIAMLQCHILAMVLARAGSNHQLALLATIS